MKSLIKLFLTGFIIIQIVTVTFVIVRNPFGDTPAYTFLVQTLNLKSTFGWSNLTRQLDFTRNMTKTVTNSVDKNGTLKINSEPIKPHVTSHVISLPAEKKPSGGNGEYPYRTYNRNCTAVSEQLRNTPFKVDEAEKVIEWYTSVDDYFTPKRTDPINMPEDEGENLFVNYDYKKPSTHELLDTQFQHFHFDGDKISCYKRGTAYMNRTNNTEQTNRTNNTEQTNRTNNTEQTNRTNNTEQTNGTNKTVCVCRPGFTGELCSVPQSVENSRNNVKRQYTFQPRKVPRRVIFAMTFNAEHIVLYLKMLQNAPAVDLFLLLEGNTTNYGDPKPLYLLPALKRGFMRRWHGKIMHMFTSDFLPEARKKGNGFQQENHIRCLFAPAMKQRVKNIRDDDLFIFFDADEAPGLDELLFLKLHDGYPVPVGFHMVLYRYGLYWWDEKVQWKAVGVAPVKMFYDVYSGNANVLRSHGAQVKNKKNKNINNFGTNPLHEVWHLGSIKNCVGWHLAFFGTPGQVLTKLMSVINADWPRWADNPVNRNITYIATLFRRGRFFDLKHDFVPMCPQNVPQFKDLEYIFKYPNFFNYLLTNPNLFIP